MKVLIWHMHGGYTDALVRGAHTYVLPVNDERDAWGGGLHGRDWPRAREAAFADLAEAEIDLVVLQRPEEVALTARLTGRTPGRDLPAVYLEHNTPKPDATGTRHPMADRSDVMIVHVTHHNRVFWDNGRAPVRVVPHGVPDPGRRYLGDLERLAVVINEPIRRGRVTGTDLLPALAAAAPVDVFGMKAEGLAAHLGVTEEEVAAAGDLRPVDLHRELARRRAYVHPYRWTSLGLSLLEAMHLGMPVVGLATTEAPRAVPPEAGFLSNDIDELVAELRRLRADPAYAAARGRDARAYALRHHSHDAFIRRWDDVFSEAVAAGAESRSVAAPADAGERRSR